MVRSPSLPLPILVRTFLQSLPRIHKQKKILWRLCVLGCHLTLLSRSWQLPPELQNALYSCCDTSRSHPGTEVPCSLILPLCLARLSPCPGGCQEEVLCVLLRHGPPRASRRGQPEDGKHFEQVSDVKRVLWEAFSCPPAVLLRPSAAFAFAVSRPDRTRCSDVAYSTNVQYLSGHGR